jgi:MtN3 and saliva related transmembrane protein
VTPAIIGTVAALLSIGSFVPQAWKLIKTRETKGIATPMWILSTSAFAVWTIYGVVLGDWPLIVPNAICFVLAAFILVFKLLPHHKRDAVADALDPTARTSSS